MLHLEIRKQKRLKNIEELDINNKQNEYIEDTENLEPELDSVEFD